MKIYADLCKLEELQSQEKESLELVRRIVKALRDLDRAGLRGGWVMRSLPLDILLSSDARPEEILKALRSGLEKDLTLRKIRVPSGKVPYAPRWAFPMMPMMGGLTPGYRYREGLLPVLITVPHTYGPFSDAGVDRVALRVAKLTGAHALVGTVSRLYIDYNRPESRLTPFRRKIEKLAEGGKVRLILDLHGTELSNDLEAEIGFFSGRTASSEAAALLESCFRRAGLRVSVEGSGLVGGDIIWYHSRPPELQGIQVELSKPARREIVRKTVIALTEFIREFGRDPDKWT